MPPPVATPPTPIQHSENAEYPDSKHSQYQAHRPQQLAVVNKGSHYIAVDGTRKLNSYYRYQVKRMHHWSLREVPICHLYHRQSVAEMPRTSSVFPPPLRRRLDRKFRRDHAQRDSNYRNDGN
jgi:hypothetical protein